MPGKCRHLGWPAEDIGHSSAPLRSRSGPTVCRVRPSSPHIWLLHPDPAARSPLDPFCRPRAFERRPSLVPGAFPTAAAFDVRMGVHRRRWRGVLCSPGYHPACGGRQPAGLVPPGWRPRFCIWRGRHFADVNPNLFNFGANSGHSGTSATDIDPTPVEIHQELVKFGRLRGKLGHIWQRSAQIGRSRPQVD